MHKFTLEDLKKALEIAKEQQKTPAKAPKAIGKAEEGRGKCLLQHLSIPKRN